MTTYNPGDIVLVHFPFTDQTTSKQRPALVLSPSGYDARAGDFVLLALTSQQQPEFGLALVEWRAAGLIKPTWFKPVVVTIVKGLILRRLGTLQPPDYPGALFALSLAIDSASFSSSSPAGEKG